MRLKDVNLQGKRVIVRTYYNVPTRQGTITDARLVMETIPTLKYILSQKPQSVVILSHRGRPRGCYVSQLSLQPIVGLLEHALARPVTFLGDCVGPETEGLCASPSPGQIFLCENVRFHLSELGEGLNQDGDRIEATPKQIELFAKALSSLGDVFVNDAFAACHQHATSMTKINLPVRCVGLLVQRELQTFSKILLNPARPCLAFLGGVRVQDKLNAILNMLDNVDEMIISGAMAFTFLKVANGMKIGDSEYDSRGWDAASAVLQKAKARGVKIHLPVDFKIGNKKSLTSDIKKATVESGIPPGWFGLDIGPATRIADAQAMWRAKTIIVVGTPGLFELPMFAYGTITMLQNLHACTTMGGANVIIGGVDSAAAAKKYKVDEKAIHVSTGGNVTLALLAGEALSALQCLTDRPNSSM